MKVLHIETGRNLYGGARQVLYLLEGLAQREDCESHLACPAGSAIGEAAENAGIAVHPLTRSGDLSLGMALQLYRLIRRVRPDLVHVHSRRGADLWGGLAARWAGVPAVISRRVDNPEPHWWANRKYSLYQGVITISEGIRQVLLREGLSPGRVVTVPSAVDSTQFRQPCDPNWFQAEFHLPAQGPVIGVIAQLIERKGHTYLLQALPALRERFPGLRVLFLGKGPLREHLEEEIQERGLDDCAQFTGFRSDLPRILPCLDLVVHPALMEGLGVSLLQAAASGVPIVGSRAGGIPEVVREGVNGRLVTPGAPDELAEAVGEILADPEMARRMGEAGRDLVKQEFDISAMVAGNYRIYQEILAARD